MALESTQPVTEMSTRNISCGGKGGRCVGLTTLLPSFADCHEIWEPQPPGSLRACTGFALYFKMYITCFDLYLGHPQACQYKNQTIYKSPTRNLVKFLYRNAWGWPNYRSKHVAQSKDNSFNYMGAAKSLARIDISSSSSCSWRVRHVTCSLILKMKLVPPSLPRSSYVSSSFWFIL